MLDILTLTGIPVVTSARFIRLPNYIFLEGNFPKNNNIKFSKDNRQKQVSFYRKMNKEKRGRVLDSKK